jgi:uncharacterized coiled-coil protein SlyX
MDIIEQAEQISNEQQKYSTIEELFDTYEVVLAFQSELIKELLDVLNGKKDKRRLAEMCEQLDMIGKMADAIDHVRDFLKEE